MIYLSILLYTVKPVVQSHPATKWNPYTWDIDITSYTADYVSMPQPNLVGITAFATQAC